MPSLEEMPLVLLERPTQSRVNLFRILNYTVIMNFMNNIKKLVRTLNNGFSVFWRAELKDIFSFCKSCAVTFEFFNTAAIANCSGPPPEGGIPIAAVSTILLSTPLHMRSISIELTYPNSMKCQTMLIK